MEVDANWKTLLFFYRYLGFLLFSTNSSFFKFRIKYTVFIQKYIYIKQLAVQAVKKDILHPTSQQYWQRQHREITESNLYLLIPNRQSPARIKLYVSNLIAAP